MLEGYPQQAGAGGEQGRGSLHAPAGIGSAAEPRSSPREGIRDPRSASRPPRGLRGSGMRHPRHGGCAPGWGTRVEPAGFADGFFPAEEAKRELLQKDLIP